MPAETMDMIENRRHFRIREYLRVKWTISSEKPGDRLETGEATIHNISSSGMKILTDELFKPFENCVFLIESPAGEELPFGSQKAKIVWFRTVHKSNGTSIQCGLQYLKNFPFDRKLKDWLDQKITGLSQAADARILNNYLY